MTRGRLSPPAREDPAMKSATGRGAERRKAMIGTSQSAARRRCVGLGVAASLLTAVACDGGAPGPAADVEMPLKAGEIGTWAGTAMQGDNGDGLDREKT